MGLFGKKKEKKEEKCCCGGNCNSGQVKTDGILVLGSGCAKCNALEEVVRQALAELGMDTEVGHVTDFGEIAAYGVMSTPALVINGKVVSYGKVLKKDEAMELIRQATSK